MRNKLVWLDIPSLYQGNPNNSDAKVWCGRTSASMVWNYYQCVRGKPTQLIRNQADKSPYNLVRPDGTIACTVAGQSGYYYLKDQVAVTGKGWKLEKLYPSANRPASVSKTKMLEILAPLIAGLDRNNPAVMYTSISGSETQPRHIIVLSGYRMDDRGELWLLIDDPFKRKVDLLGASNFDTVGPPDGPVLMEGGIDAKGARYWLRGMRFFEENSHSTRKGDLFCDHCDSPDFLCIYNDTLETPNSPYSHRLNNRSVTFPFDGERDADSPVRYLFRNESRKAGGFYPLGGFANIHSGIHLSPESASGPLAPVRCLAPGYVVAARMTGALPSSIAAASPADGLAQSALSQEIALAGNSFVLVRHVLEEKVPADGDAEPKTFTFHTLYMHLVPPEWTDEESAKAHGRVPWINELMRRRNGSVIIADPGLSTFGKVWLPAAEESQKTRGGGPLEVFGDTLNDEVVADIGPAEDGRIVAVCRKADPALQKALDALAAGKVVTCPQAALPVAGADILGYVQSAPTAFLHWEVLAPSGADGGIEAMLDFASEKLGLGAGFFKQFQEKTENNLFDPEGDELSSLLALLPAEDDDRENALSPTYDRTKVTRLFNSPDQITFATEKPDGAKTQPGELAYPLRLSLENFKNTVPAGTYTLKIGFEPADFPKRTVQFDIAAGHVDLMVPAGATKIILESDTYFIELDPRRPTKEEDAAHFKRLASARLRNVVLEHLNEWSTDGLVAAMEPRFEGQEMDFDAYAKATAFWANEEHALLVQDGSEKKLFGGSAADGQLAEKTKLAQAHPVSVAWIASLLVNHGLARFRDKHPPPGSSEAAQKLFFLGWMPDYAPPKPRLVGEPLHAVAVAAGDVDGGEEVVLQAAGPGSAAPVVIARRTYEKGILRATLPCPFWGDWTLSVPGQSPEVGHVSLTGLEPVLGDLSAPVRDKKTGAYTWTIHFTNNRPGRIQGLVLMEYWKTAAAEAPVGPGTPASIAIPLCAEPLPPDPKSPLKLDATSQFYVGGKGKVTSSFGIDEYTKVFAGDAGSFRLSVALAERIEVIRAAYGKILKNTKTGLTPVSLSADGLSAHINCSKDTTTNQDALRTAAKQSQPQLAALEELDKGVRVTVAPPPPGVAGPVVGGFDPAAAFNALLAEASPGPKDQLHVRFGVFFPNGGTLVLPAGSDGQSTGTVSANLLALRAACPGALEAFTAAPTATLRKPQFGPVTAAMDGEGMTLTTTLCGADADWAAAKPAFVYKNKTGAEKSTGKRTAGCLTASILLTDPQVAARKVTFEARVTKADALFDGSKVAVAPVSIEIDTTPKLGEITITWTETDLVVSCVAQSFPTTKAVALTVRKIGPEGEEDTGLGQAAVFNRAYKTCQGFTDSAGNIVARVGRAKVAQKLVPGDKLKAEIFRPKEYGAVLGQTIEPVSAEGTVPEA